MADGFNEYIDLVSLCIVKTTLPTSKALQGTLDFLQNTEESHIYYNSCLCYCNGHKRYTRPTGAG